MTAESPPTKHGRSPVRQRFAATLCFCLALLLRSTVAGAGVEPSPTKPDELWLLLNPTEQRLQVMLGEYPVLYYHGVAWGRGGIGIKKQLGDRVTPVGDFRIRWINRDSKFRLFFGLDYPNPPYAHRGLHNGTLTNAQHTKILKDWNRNKTPPQDTAMGGSLGIHGLGNASLEVHQKVNWTNGCIALNNAQIDHLSRFISVGTRVVIRP